MIINNSISKDDDIVRSERLTLVSANIDEYGGDLDLSADMLVWAQNAHEQWSELCAISSVETGQTKDAYIMYHYELKEVGKYYNAVKAMLIAIINSSPIEDDIKEAYHIEGKTLRTRDGLTTAIETLKNTHDKLKIEGDTRVLPDNIVDKLVQRREELIERWYKTLGEKKEAKEARELRKRVFAGDTKRLACLLSICKLKWGFDDTRLDLLGFKHKSAIWTFKKKSEEDETTENAKD